MTVRVEDERWRRLRQAKGLDTAGGELALKAPIPGLVVKVLIADGEQVHTGQSLVILEAMKMENDLRAPRAATVGHVKVKPGDRVEQGQVLLTLQADA
jgi:biotin carboxyl carrier protein